MYSDLCKSSKLQFSRQCKAINCIHECVTSSNNKLWFESMIKIAGWGGGTYIVLFLYDFQDYEPHSPVRIWGVRQISLSLHYSHCLYSCPRPYCHINDVSVFARPGLLHVITELFLSSTGVACSNSTCHTFEYLIF